MTVIAPADRRTPLVTSKDTSYDICASIGAADAAIDCFIESRMDNEE